MPYAHGMECTDLLICLGERIRTIRKEQNMTQERLAELADLNLSYTSEIERGQANVSLCIVNSIAEALGMSVGELLIGISKGKASDDFLVLLQQVQTLDENQQRIFVGAAKGILAGIRDV